MNPYYPRHWGIGFGKGGAGMRRPLSQEYCLNYTVNYRKIEKYDKIAKKRIFIVDYFIPPLWGSEFRSLTLAKYPPISPLQLPIYLSPCGQKKSPLHPWGAKRTIFVV